jgi:hypothetical protein
MRRSSSSIIKNEKFGFYLLRLIGERLLENIDTKTIAKNLREMRQDLQASLFSARTDASATARSA